MLSVIPLQLFLQELSVLLPHFLRALDGHFSPPAEDPAVEVGAEADFYCCNEAVAAVFLCTDLRAELVDEDTHHVLVTEELHLSHVLGSVHAEDFLGVLLHPVALRPSDNLIREDPWNIVDAVNPEGTDLAPLVTVAGEVVGIPVPDEVIGADGIGAPSLRRTRSFLRL